MLHFIRDCVFRPHSPLHHEFSNSLEQLIAKRITHRESEWFPCMFHNLRILQAAVTELQAKCVDLEAKLEVYQQKIDVLQLSMENATRTAASASDDAAAAWTRSLQIESDLQRLQDELSKNYVILHKFLQSFQLDSLSQQQQFQSPAQHPHRQPSSSYPP